MTPDNAKIKDFLDLSPITKSLLMQNEMKANKVIAKVQVYFAFILIVLIILIRIEKVFFYNSIEIIILAFISIFCLAVSFFVLSKNKYSSTTKHILISALIIETFLMKFYISDALSCWMILPIVVVTAYNDKNFTLRVAFFTGFFYLLSDVLSILLRWFNDINYIVLPESVKVVLNADYSRFYIVDQIDVSKTLYNYVVRYFPILITFWIVLTIACYIISRKNYNNLIIQAELAEAKARADEELALGKAIQSNMVPINFGDITDKCKNIDIYGLMMTEDEIFGDIYDFYLIDSKHLCVFIGDTSASGTAAALYLDKVKQLLSEISKETMHPAEILTKINKELCKNNKIEVFMTAWLGILDVESGFMEYSCAGEDKPYKSTEGIFNAITDTPNNLLLGAINDIEYKSAEIHFNSGDRLFLYTDGATAVVNFDKELFGSERLLECLNKNNNKNVKDMLSDIQQEINDFSAEGELPDDITMLCIEYR